MTAYYGEAFVYDRWVYGMGRSIDEARRQVFDQIDGKIWNSRSVAPTIYRIDGISPFEFLQSTEAWNSTPLRERINLVNIPHQHVRLAERPHVYLLRGMPVLAATGKQAKRETFNTFTWTIPGGYIGFDYYALNTYFFTTNKRVDYGFSR